MQVWFQNKRQRERKLSRAQGLLSTPGLPDTPAVAAAAAAVRSTSSDDLTASMGMPENGNLPAREGGGENNTGMSAIPPSGATDGTSFKKALRGTGSGPVPRRLIAKGHPMVRSLSNPDPWGGNSGLGGISLVRRMSGIPLSGANMSFGGEIGYSRDGTGRSRDDCDMSLGGLQPLKLHVAPQMPHCGGFPMHSSMVAEQTWDALIMGQGGAMHAGQHLQDPDQQLHHDGNTTSLHGIDGLPHTQSPHFLANFSYLPYHNAMHASMEKAELLRRSGMVAASPEMSSSPPHAEAILQSLLPRNFSNRNYREPSHSVKQEDGLLKAPHGDRMQAASLSTTFGAGCMAGNIDGLDELPTFDFPEELQQDLFHDNPCPSLNPTPSTNEVLLRTAAGNGGANSNCYQEHDDLLGALPALPFQMRMEALPMVRSGWSACDSDDASGVSMETVPFTEQDQYNDRGV